MAKRTEEQRAQFRANLRHPVAWLKGEGLPEEKVRPWELAAQIVPNVFGGLRDTFTGNLGWLWQNVFHMDKGPQAVMGTVSAVWDGLNDPFIGAYMDYKNYPSRVHRWVMRVSVLVNNLLTLALVFDLGLSVWQRVALIILINCIKDFFGTAAGVSGAKVYAQITPHSSQRARVVTASKFGGMIHSNISTGFMLLIGLRDILGFSPYKMFVWWSVLFTLPALFTDMAPTFVLQRVPDPAQPQGKLGFKETLQEIRESFAIMRHNKFFVVNTAARMFAVFTPGVGNADFYRFCGINDTVAAAFKAWEDKGTGELLLAVRNFATGAPSSILQPLAPLVIKKLGGPRNMLLLNSAMNAGTYLLRYLLGFKTVPAILIGWGLEVFMNMAGKWDSVANGVIEYEMLDYVEWKTGRRSEGVATAVNGLINKIVLNNIDMIVGNLALKRIGFDINLDLNQPASYVKWATIFYFLSPVLDNLAYFVARWFYRYPTEMRDRVEAELIERRGLAEQALGDLATNTQ